ncbi:MAG: qor2 [Frankiales bacterium]|nr:qor2 [Frankiales bacterium]
MKAVLCTRFGGPEFLEIGEVDDPVPGPDQVVIDVKACAVNVTDLLVIQDKYQYRQQLPFIPGGEGAGVVRAIGPGVTNVAIGDRVLGAGQTGGLAEQKLVAARSVVAIPDGFDFVSASGLTYAYGTALHSLQLRANIQPGESLLVLAAAGGVGLATIEIGKLLGARVIAAASSDDKLKLCTERGADEVINYETEDLKVRVRELTGGRGADVVMDPVGGKYAEPAVRATAWDGRYLIVGFAAGIPSIPLNLPLLRGCNLIGVFLGEFVNQHPDQARATNAQLSNWWHDGTLKPHVWNTYPLEQAATALQLLADRRVVGKAVVTPS